MRANPVGWVLVGFFLLGGIAFTITIPEIWIGQIWIGVSLLLAAVYLLMGRAAARNEELKRTGIPAQAQILEMTQTGMYVNEQPQVRLKLRIQPQGRAPYELEKSVVVPMIALGTLTSGRALSVFVDENDPNRIAIDWSGGAAAPFTVASEGGGQVNVGDPAAQQAVMQALHEYGIDPSKGTVDLRNQPAARAAVLDALRKHGVDAAHSQAAADPSIPVQAAEDKGEPLDRLTKLMQLRSANLITDEEFQEHRKRILEDV